MKCPLCDAVLDIDDVDYRFEGNKDVMACCPQCHHYFEFFIRFHKIWKYTINEMYFDERYKSWIIDDSIPIKIVKP